MTSVVLFWPMLVLASYINIRRYCIEVLLQDTQRYYLQVLRRTLRA